MVGCAGGLQLAFPAVRFTDGRAATLGKRCSATQWAAAVSSSDVRLQRHDGACADFQLTVAVWLACAEDHWM